MAEAHPCRRPPWWRRHWLALIVLGLIGLLAYAVLAAIVLPGWIVSVSAAKADENHRLDAIVNTRGTLLGVLAPVVVAIGAVAAFLNYRETSTQNRRSVELSRETLDVARRGQLTERFTKAIDQLGQTAEDKLDIRLGGIYALEQIAKESKELHGPVMEILTAFLREHSPNAKETSAEFAPPRADFQAIATVLGRRQVGHDPDGFRLDFRGVALDVVNFEGAQLQGAVFWEVKLQKANFAYAQLQGASFAHAQLQEAIFEGAQLQGAVFLDVKLQGAYFSGADLERARFEPHRRNAAGDVDMTWEQLAQARNVGKAFLPDYLTRARESQPGRAQVE
jgi:hypothetical protein